MSNKFKVIGLTGGVGSGKTYIAQYTKEVFGIPVIFADEIGHSALLTGTKTYQQVTSVFGEGILREDKTVDRRILGDLVFSNKEELKKLNGIVHPFIQSEIVKEIKHQSDTSKKNYIIVEAAILLESNLIDLCDEIWFVKADKKLRQKRLAETRGYTKEKIEAIMDAQLSDDEMSKRSDVTITNDGDLHKIHKQLELLLV